MHFQSSEPTQSKKFGGLEDIARYPGAGANLKFTNQLSFVDPQRYDGIPVYRVSSSDGKIINPDEDPNVRMKLSPYFILYSTSKSHILFISIDLQKLIFKKQVLNNFLDFPGFL